MRLGIENARQRRVLPWTVAENSKSLTADCLVDQPILQVTRNLTAHSESR